MDSAAAAGAGLAGFDVSMSADSSGWLEFMTGVALGALTGALFGTGLTALTRLLSRGPGVALVLAYPVAGLLGGMILAGELGAFARLGSAYHQLALLLLFMSAVGGLGLGLLGWSMQPNQRFPVGYWFARDRIRPFVAVGLLVVAFGISYFDMDYLTGQYPLGHAALRLGSLYVGTCAVRLGWPYPLVSTDRKRRLVLGVAAGWIVIALVLLNHPGNSGVAANLLARNTVASMLKLVRTASDIDRDGYSSLLNGGDCAPFDPKVNPGEREIPGNGIDDNCLLGDGKPFDKASLKPSGAAPPEPPPVDVVLITVDTLRFDRLELYGNERETTPELTRWSKRALRFDRAYTPGGITSIAMPSLFRGVYPRRLRWTQLVDTKKYRLVRLQEARKLVGDSPRVRFALPLDDPTWSMAEWLRWRGMQTAAVVDDGWIAEILDPRYMGQGFDHFVQGDELPAPLQNDDAGTATAAIDQLERLRAAERPYFLWVHFFGLHGPTQQRPGLPYHSRAPEDEYDHALVYFDEQLGRLLRVLDEQRTVVILTSDHGEHFATTRRFHGVDMKETSIRVPLFIRAPGARAGIESSVVSSVDLLPTVLALTETVIPPGFDGIDLTPLLARAIRPRPRAVFSDTWSITRSGGMGRDLTAAISADHKLVIDRLTSARLFLDSNDRALPEGPALELERALDGYLEATGGEPLFVER